MMELYKNNHIEEMPLQSPFFRKKVDGFLQANGLRMETLDVYYTLQNTEGDILAGAGLAGDVLKCVAVAPEAREEGLVAPLVSHILSQHGPGNVKVFTKPEYESVFASLGFHLIARAPLAILMENGRGLETYCAYLRSLAGDARASSAHTTGVVVMNANPFTLGHQYLLEQAAAQVDRLVVIPVKEDVSAFTYEERLAMIRAGAATVSASPVIVADGSDYQISAATFPTYFLKDLSDAARTQMQLDLDLFARHIAPALGATVRFVGSEPLDALTAGYNALMQERLPVRVVEIPRLCHSAQREESVISASLVRQALEQGSYSRAAALCPESTRPYLLAFLADRALRKELDTPLKPGLVCPDSKGAHKDMDYALMQKGIAALRPYWSRMAKATVPPLLQMIGIEAEKAMKKATGGVNTHRGAIFALGLALNARGVEVSVSEEVMQNNLARIAQAILCNSVTDTDSHSTHGGQAVKQYGVKGAREMALEGYKDLWADWLPYYRSLSGMETASCQLQRTLLRIMSTLDDTCVIHRAGYARAQQVKREAADLLSCPEPCGRLQTLCDQYAAEGISPGGAADMLALTLLTNSLINL
ncbi:MAG: triphosphoribosyl-dephospho-CoA synthase [Bacteroidales bacterium]|nr:triphosphoribosyl-dephospho-CoA synthase [Bacteroidales bacterium]